MQQQWRQRAGDWMNYGDPQGLAPLRAAISSYLVQSRGVQCEPDQILIGDEIVILYPGDADYESGVPQPPASRPVNRLLMRDGLWQRP